MKYEEEMLRQYAILDKYDFLPYLEFYDDIDQLMFNFEYECDNSILPEDFEGCVFNYISTEEFVDYIKKRYPDYYIVETIKYKIQKI